MKREVFEGRREEVSRVWAYFARVWESLDGESSRRGGGEKVR